MFLRGLCVCSFGLRTIAVLMSLFPSLGISSFHTAVCCDGENEYTTPAPVCQPLFAFFFGFFCVFFRGWRLAFFYTGPSRASGTGMPGFTQYLYKFWHAAFTRPFDRLGDRARCQLDAALRVQGQDAASRGGGRHFCKVKCQLGQIPNQVRDDGLRWGWLASLGVGAFTDSRSGPGMTAGLLHRGCFRGYTFCAALRQGQGPDFDASLRLHCGFRRGLVQDSRVEPENDTIAKSWNDVLVLVMMEVGFYSALRLAQGPGFDARWRLRCEFQGPGDFGITVFFLFWG